MLFSLEKKTTNVIFWQSDLVSRLRNLKILLFFFIPDAYLKEHVQYKWKNKHIKMISKEMAQYTVLGAKTQERYSKLFIEIGRSVVSFIEEQKSSKVYVAEQHFP